MASVSIDLIPPDQPDLTKLLIYEAPASSGPWTLIETVIDVGSYPTYISRYTTDDATSANDWFSVDWEDSKGARIGQSIGVQGGTALLIGKVVNRVLQRDPLISEPIAYQEAEAILSSYFNVDDPYSSTLTATYKELAGLTYLVMARTYLSQIITSASTTDNYTAGLVSQKSGAASEQRDRVKLVRDLIDEANTLLGKTTTLVMLIEDIDPLGLGIVTAVEWDHSRLQVTEIE
jgi:hypothetical protein